jgi:hypothetical protein
VEHLEQTAPLVQAEQVVQAVRPVQAELLALTVLLEHQALLVQVEPAAHRVHPAPAEQAGLLERVVQAAKMEYLRALYIL